MTSNSNGDGVYRLTPKETEDRLGQDAASIFTTVDANGQQSANSGLRLLEMEPVAPAPVSLPVGVTAAELAIRSDGAATHAAIQLDYERKKTAIDGELAAGLGTLGYCRYCAEDAGRGLALAIADREAFLAGLPRRWRRRLGRRPSRLAKVVPWAMWGADTMFLSRAYGILGPLPLPFHASVYMTNVTEVLRAGLVSFGLVFGLRLVGGKVREAAEELRDRNAAVGTLCDLTIGGLVVAAGIRLAESTAKLQKALIDVVAGGTTVHVPVSVVFSIVAFLASVSLAAGYFLAEPEIDRGLELDETIETAKTRLRDAMRAVFTQLGVVRALRKRLMSLPAEKQHELAENQAHTERRVYTHKAGNVAIYGLETTSPAETS